MIVIPTPIPDPNPSTLSVAAMAEFVSENKKNSLPQCKHVTGNKQAIIITVSFTLKEGMLHKRLYALSG